MPISHQHQCIFIHIPKTGGQSIHHIINTHTEKELVGYSSNFIELTHLNALKIQELFPNEFNSYFKFSIVRNPYDRIVSEYVFSLKKRYRLYLPQFNLSFKKFVQKISEIDQNNQKHMCINHIIPQYEFIYHHDKCLVDYIGKFEDFQNSIKYIQDQLHVNVETQHLNKTVHKPYEKYFDKETKEIIYNMYQKDFELFNYSF